MLQDVAAAAVAVDLEKMRSVAADFVASVVVGLQLLRTTVYFDVGCIGCCKRTDRFLLEY